MDVALTFDTDWVPDFILEYVFSIIEEYGFHATTFFTNSVKLNVPDFMEIGIHPNFSPLERYHQSDYEAGDYQAVLDDLLSHFPNVSGVRTHKLYWDYDLYDLFPRKGLLYDSSILLAFHPHLEVNTTYGSLRRIPVWWTDNLHLDRQLALDSASFLDFSLPGLKVLLFHPIHIYLNSPNRKIFRDQVASMGSLQDRTPQDLEPLRYSGVGIETLLRSICDRLRDRGIKPKALRELIL